MPVAGRTRCEWAESDALMRAYHDEEWGVPQRDSRMLWEMLMLEGFQAGLAWIIILRKRDAFRKAFAKFDPEKVARFGKRDITRLMGDAGIVRARAKTCQTDAAWCGTSFAPTTSRRAAGTSRSIEEPARVSSTSRSVSRSARARLAAAKWPCPQRPPARPRPLCTSGPTRS